MHSKLLSGIEPNKKGFSLIELIIVVAIMVALVAVIAPTYVKYVKQARDSVIDNAAEEVADYIKAEHASQNFLTNTEKVVLKVAKDDSNRLDITLEEGEISYNDLSGDAAITNLIQDCGIDKNREVKTDRYCLITISASDLKISLNSKIDIAIQGSD